MREVAMSRAFEQAREEGRIEGRAEGREIERVENIKSIIEISKMSEKEEMDLLRIPATEREKFSALMKV